MQIRALLVTAILSLSLTAVADFRTITEVHEVALVNLRLPATSNGTLTFSTCIDCEAVILRVNSASQYVLNGRPMNLASFRKAMTGVINREDVTVDVFHHLETGTATKVRVRL